MVLPVIKLLVIICICSNAYGFYDATDKSTSKKDMELERQVQFLNRTSVIKTIQLEEGDIIDCIDINKQPALDHPLLKNHKVQIRPRSFPAEMEKSFRMAKNLQIRSRKEVCPYGTVPIHRSTNDDSLNARFFANKLSTNGGHPNKSLRVFLLMNQSQNNRLYRGAFGSVSVYNISVGQQDQFSSSNIWIETGRTYLVAGVMVNPLLNGDQIPRWFIYWKGDGNKGCYNTRCNGFVQVNRYIGPNHPIMNLSTYGGPTYDVRPSIFQDKKTGIWWFAIAGKNFLVGYWPKEIITELKDGARRVAWGGTAYSGKAGISPQMGSGHKPDGRYDHAAFFRHVHYMDSDFVAQVPFGNDAKKHVDEYSCYDLKDDQDTGTDRWGYIFTFGGPGGFCG